MSTDTDVKFLKTAKQLLHTSIKFCVDKVLKKVFVEIEPISNLLNVTSLNKYITRWIDSFSNIVPSIIFLSTLGLKAINKYVYQTNNFVL